VNSKSQLQKIRRIYDRDPARYHRSMSGAVTEWMLSGRRHQVGESVTGRLLDIAFGTGLSLPHYPPSVSVTGIDASLGMLRFAQRDFDRLGRRAGLVQMDAEHLAFPDRTFDSVAFNLCLCTIARPELAVREAVRVVKPGAPLVFLEHVRSHLLPVALVLDAISPVLVVLQQDHFNRRTVQIVRRAGVEVESVDRWLLGFFNLIVGRAPGR
jgi:ubiquinone/menaquinone biosynthesis C-methylase UbiE